MNFRKINKGLMVFGLAALYTINTFAAAVDVPSNHWAYSAIEDLKDRGIITYNSKNQFFPNNQMTFFEVAEIIANATGYVNVQLPTSNVDENFKKQIVENYNKQKPLLDTYSAKHSTWDKLYDQQVAYILGRYVKSEDREVELNKYMTTVNGVETRAIMTKQDLAVYIVRMLEKENTAVSSYVPGGFKDESLIKEANRPYMAYLKSVGIITPDAKGNCNPNTPVTKALAAKMVSDALKVKEQGLGQEAANSGSSSTIENATSQTVTLKKILTKSNTEYFLVVDKGTGSVYYSVKNTLKPIDMTGKEMSLTSLIPEQKLAITSELVNNTQYITSIKVVGDGNSSIGIGTNTGTGTSTDTAVNTVSGNLLEKVTNGIVRISSGENQTRVYILDNNATITLNGVYVESSALSAGDGVVVTVQNATITKVQATKGTGSITSTLGNGEITARQMVAEGYNITLKQGNSESVVFIPEKAIIKRNNKVKNLEDLRVGDQISLSKAGNTVTEVVATGEQSRNTGMIKEIHLAQPNRVVVKLDNGETVTYTLSGDTEIYDVNTRKYINVRELHLGQSIDLLLESKEVVSLDVVKSTNGVNYKGVIKYATRSSDYIEVLVEYDPISGQTGIYKRIEVPSSISIINSNNRQVNRNSLEEDMEIIITYKYLDDATPEKILIIG